MTVSGEAAVTLLVRFKQSKRQQCEHYLDLKDAIEWYLIIFSHNYNNKEIFDFIDLFKRLVCPPPCPLQIMMAVRLLTVALTESHLLPFSSISILQTIIPQSASHS